MIEKKQALKNENEKTDEQAIERLLPKKYADLRKGFSKTISDILASHRLYNHQIKLKTENILSYNLLYQYNLKELLVTKKYIKKNLHKSFIKFN